MNWARRPLLGLVAALACGASAALARADERDEPMPPALRARAERSALQGYFLFLVRNRDYARWIRLESLPPPLNRWRIDIGWQAGRDGAVGLAPLAARQEPACNSFQEPGTFADLKEWRVVQALLTDRCWRETKGAGSLPDGSPLAGLPDPDGTIARFLDLQRSVYQPVPPEQSPDAAWATAARASRELADSLRSTSHLWAALAAGLLLLFTLVVGLRLRSTPV